MLEAFRKAFKIKDIRKKIGYTFLMLIVIRIGSQLPTPGVNGEYIKNFFAQNTGEAFNLFNAFTGGSFEQMSVFALSITPYITSSIIVQLLTIAIPQLEEMQRDGETGRKKIVAITRYLTVGLALIESGAMAVEIRNPKVSGGAFIPPFQGGVSRGSVRVGVVKTFLLPSYGFSFGYKRKGVSFAPLTEARRNTVRHKYALRLL